MKDDLAGGRLPSGLFGANAARAGDHGLPNLKRDDEASACSAAIGRRGA